MATETDTGTSYVIRSGDPLDDGGEYWQDCDLSRVSWGPLATAFRFTAAHRADMEQLAGRLGGEWVPA